MEPLKAPKSYAQIAKECQAEIDRLKAELEDSEKHCHELHQANKSLRSQLAEAREEVERFKHMAEQNSTEKVLWSFLLR